jgi:hypothetical protein
MDDIKLNLSREDLQVILDALESETDSIEFVLRLAIIQKIKEQLDK